MKIGYARVSTQEQELGLQLDALNKAGCAQIYQEKASGKNTDRPELQLMLSRLRPGDQVVIWKLDRIGRSIKNLIDLVERFSEMKVDLISVQDHIDTSSATGKLTFHIFAALAEYERGMIQERTRAGLAAAKARGKTPGRRAGLSAGAQKVATRVYQLHKESSLTVTEIAETLKIGKSTAYRYIDIMQKQLNPS